MMRALAPGVVALQLVASSDAASAGNGLVEHGAALFADAHAARSPANVLACADCHSTTMVDGTRIYPGGPLDGVVERPSFWGGQETDLLRAINDCRSLLMGARDPWTDGSDEFRAMLAYLSSLEPAVTDPIPFTVVREIVTPPCKTADSGAGEHLFRDACEHCHGEAHTGAGRKAMSIPVLPEDTYATHHLGASCDQQEPGSIFLSKIRHGTFFGEGGSMPPFALEVLSEDDVGDLFTFLGMVPGNGER
jgi:thiosulfate dehydrogenase